MTRRVMPRKALEAESSAMVEGEWRIHYPSAFVSDSLFASAFVDAELFDAVLTAARAEKGRHADFPTSRSSAWRYTVDCHCPVCVALRAYDEGQAQ